MGKGNKTQPFVFNLTAWYNLSPGFNMLGGSFKAYYRARANRPSPASAGELFPYTQQWCCVPISVMSTQG